MNKIAIDVTVNGEAHTVEVPARRMLSDLLRMSSVPACWRGCRSRVRRQLSRHLPR